MISFPVDVAINFDAYLLLLQLVVVCLFAASDLLFQDWDPIVTIYLHSVTLARAMSQTY